MAQPPTSDEVRRQEELNKRAEGRSRIAYVVAVVFLLIGIGAAVAQFTYEVFVNPYTYEVSPLPGLLFTIGLTGSIVLFAVGLSIRNQARIGIKTMCPQCKKWRARLLVGTEELGSSEHWETVYDTVETTTQIRNSDGSYSDATSTTTQPRTARVSYAYYLNEFSCRFCGFKWKEASTSSFVW